MTEILLLEKFRQLPESSQDTVLKFIEFLLNETQPDMAALKPSKRVKKSNKTFTAVRLDTRGFKFNREEANER